MAYNPLAFGLMLVSMGALIFSAYVHNQLKSKSSLKQEKGFGGVFVTLGFIAGIFAFSLYFFETIPAQYIEVYGVGYFVFSILLVVGGLSMFYEWDKVPLSYLAFVCGIVLLNSARTVYYYAMSKSPLATTALFGGAGLGAMSTLFLTHLGAKKTPKWVGFLVVLAFVCVGLLALYSGVNAQFGHVGSALAKAAAAK
jgi:uncharacterized membrane protein